MTDRSKRRQRRLDRLAWYRREYWKTLKEHCDNAEVSIDTVSYHLAYREKLLIKSAPREADLARQALDQVVTTIATRIKEEGSPGR